MTVWLPKSEARTAQGRPAASAAARSAPQEASSRTEPEMEPVEIKGLVEARFGLALDYAVWRTPAEMIRSLYEDQRPEDDTPEVGEAT